MKQDIGNEEYNKLLVKEILLEVKEMRKIMESNFNDFIGWLDGQADIALLDLLFLKEYMRIKGGEINDDLMYLIEKIAADNNRIPHLTYEDLIFINPLDDDPRTFFSGKIGSVESDFYRGHNQIEQKFDYVVSTVLELMQKLDSGSIDEEKIKSTIQKVSQSWREAMQMLGKYHQIPQEEFKIFRQYFQGHEEIGYKRGASGAFSAAIPLLDLLLGEDTLEQANMPYFEQHIDYYPRGAKDLLLQAKKNIKSKKTLREYVEKYKNEDLESLYNLINKSILQFRKAHKDVVRKQTPEIYNGQLDSTGKFDKTGGGFLNDNIAQQEKSLKTRKPISVEINEKKYPSRVLRGREGLEHIASLAEHRKNMIRCLTGMRPTGKLHLGHYLGALKMRKELQEMDHVDCFFLLADYHALSDNAHDIQKVRQNVREVAIDWMSVGLSPLKSHFVVQSYVPETAELTQFLQTFTPKRFLDNNPTLKNEMEKIRENPQNKGALSLAFYNYPSSQMADILLPQGEIVAVGDDQIPHIEDTRKVAERINKLGMIFPHKPFALLSEVPRLVGVDGKDKMGKSLNNAILLSDDASTVEQKVRKMYTYPRAKATDPGKVEGHVVFTYLDALFTDKKLLNDYKLRYERGGKYAPGDGELKMMLTETINNLLDPIRLKRQEIEETPEIITQALEEGSDYERVIAKETIKNLKETLGILRY